VVVSEISTLIYTRINLRGSTCQPSQSPICYISRISRLLVHRRLRNNDCPDFRRTPEILPIGGRTCMLQCMNDFSLLADLCQLNLRSQQDRWQSMRYVLWQNKGNWQQLRLADLLPKQIYLPETGSIFQSRVEILPAYLYTRTSHPICLRKSTAHLSCFHNKCSRCASPLEQRVSTFMLRQYGDSWNPC
jgi:hypothetical protein